MKINEAARLTGVTVRTLQYYDKIGLLKPTSVAENGYREYDNECLKKLQQILFLKELDFSIKEIKVIISNKLYEEKEIMEKQKNLLVEKRNRLDKIINLLEKNIDDKKDLSFKEFSMEEIYRMKNKYAQEVKERWGNTLEFKEYTEKVTGRTEKENSLVDKGVNEIMKEFSAIRHMPPNSCEARGLVNKWKQYITQNYYECTNEILLSLSLMYTEDERFKKNIDANGEGTADFIRRAIECYCNQ